MTTEGLRPLVSVKQHNIALVFCDYLDTIEIRAQINNENDNFVIYCQPDKYELAVVEFKQFIEQPYQAKYQQAAWKNGNITDVNPHSPPLLTSFKKQFFAHAGIVTLSVFILCWAVFIASLLGWAGTIFQQLKFYSYLNLEQIFQAPHRLLGPALFHFSWLHIVFNTMWWWQLGGSVEQTFGRASLIKLFLATAVISNLGQFIVDGPNFAGLSGVVYGLVGYVWWLGWLLPEKGLTLSKPIVGFMLFWLLLGYTSILPFNIANTAHLLGLVSGCCLAYLKVLKEKKRV